MPFFVVVLIVVLVIWAISSIPGWILVGGILAVVGYTVWAVATNDAREARKRRDAFDAKLRYDERELSDRVDFAEQQLSRAEAEANAEIDRIMKGR